MATDYENQKMDGGFVDCLCFSKLIWLREKTHSGWPRNGKRSTLEGIHPIPLGQL
jgi:hypothetical protein